MQLMCHLIHKFIFFPPYLPYLHFSLTWLAYFNMSLHMFVSLKSALNIFEARINRKQKYVPQKSIAFVLLRWKKKSTKAFQSRKEKLHNAKHLEHTLCKNQMEKCKCIFAVEKKYINGAHFSSTYIKTGARQRLAWSLLKDDTHLQSIPYFQILVKGYRFPAIR